MTAPVTLLGPAFVATIVYVFFVPATADVLPSLTVTFKSALKVMVSVSVALLLARLGSLIPLGLVTLALSETVPVAAALSLPVAL